MTAPPAIDAPATGRPVVDAGGVRIALDLAGLDESRAAAVREAWNDALAEDQLSPADAVLAVDEDPSDAQLLNELSHGVTRTAIEHRRGSAWMLHAGAVARDDGTVVVLVGASGSGKTTAVHALGRVFGYVTDETVFIDADGGVAAYRKPLSVVADGEGRMPKRERSASALGLRELPRVSLRVGAILLLDRRPDAPAVPAFEDVELGDALPSLVAQSSHLPALPAALQTMARITAAVGGVRRVTYRDAEDLVSVMVEPVMVEPVMVEGLDRSSTPARVREPDRESPGRSRAAEVGGGDRPADHATVYRCARAGDILELHDPHRLAILADATVHVIAGIAPAIWRAADAAEGADPARLTSAVVAEHGMPASGDPDGAVLAAVEVLVDAGLLVREAPGWSLRPDVAWTDDGHQVIALALADRRSPTPLALSGSSAAIWRAVAGARGTELDGVIAALAADYDVPPAAIRAQVEAFLDELRAADLITSTN